MLIARLQRIGKIHRAEYRLVVAEKRRHVSKLAHEVLGNYNPATKKLTITKPEALQKFLDLNIELSETVKSILKKNGFEKKAVKKAVKEAKPAKKVVEKSEKPAAKKPAAKKTTKAK